MSAKAAASAPQRGAEVTQEARPEFRLRLVLTTRAARDVLGLLPGVAQPEGTPALPDAEARDRATAALAQLLGLRQAYDVYLRNGGQGEGDEQVVEVRLAGDSEHGANTALLRKLDGKSLLLVGAEKDDRQTGESQFLVFGARAIPAVWSRKDAWSRTARVSFGLGPAGGEAGFPLRLLAAIGKLPEARAQRESIQRRLADWHRYLAILERTARARQFAVNYTAFRRPPGGILVTFTLQAAGEPIPWDKLRSALDEPLEVRERTSAAAGLDELDADDWLLGYVAEVAPGRSELVVAVDDDVDRLLDRGRLELPKAATLAYKASGDLAQIRRLKFGLELLEQGQAANANLSSFVFEGARARRPDPARRIQLQADALLQPSLNPGQRAAVEGAFNAPDLFLIQGPPGTGKTTVIAEICYQNALRGQRTLIASQSNLAVDHALSRLIHHPRIRALRRGHAGRVEVEGAPFLEDQVVGTWLAQTARACEADLAARRENVRLFEDLLHNLPRLEALAAGLQAAEAERPRQQAEIAALEAKTTPFKQQLEQMGRALERRRAARASLARLEARFRSGAPAYPAGDGHRAETTEMHRPSESLAERMRWFDHVALHQLQANQAQLNAALQSWEVEPAPPPEPETAPGFEEALAVAQVARQRANELLERLAALRSYLDELGQAAAAWYRGRVQRSTLETEAQSLASRRLALEARRDLLLAQQADLQAKLDELAGFDAAQAPVKGALQSWADRLTREDAGPATDAQLSPPPEFDTPLRRELWAEAGETAQLHRLGAQVLELRTSRAEARRLAELAVQLSAGVERLQVELKPETAQHAAAARPRRAADWRASPLRALVALDAHGGLHPASGAEAVWKGLEQQLLRQMRRPNLWGSLAGRERQRQADLSQWVQRLRAAAGAFTDRRAELEAFARHRAARLQERVEASAPSLQAAVEQAAKAFGPQAEQRLRQVRAELAVVEQELPGVIASLAAAEQEQAALASAQAQHEARLMAGLEALGTGRPTRHFQYLLRQLDKLPADNWQADWRAACGGFDEAVGRVAALLEGVDPAATLAAIAVDIDEDIQRMAHNLERVRLNRHALERELQIARGHARDLDEQLAGEVEWWRAVQAALPERLRLSIEQPDAPPESVAYLQAALKASAGWTQALEAERAYLARAEKLVGDWVRRLRSADERDREDLRQIYIDNANVIGITCVQAGAFHFSREYRNFDCVIVDEVSKATPPELLLPMLKGARVILVGDHRQLPPMIGPETITELAAELGVPAAELEHLERSLFQELFESAPPELRVMLTEQYRMHPQIMQAINQFYDDQLVCALPQPDEQRAHGFNLPWLRPDNHLLWLNTPASGAFLEQRSGTSFVNAGELDVVERLLHELDTAWGPLVARGTPPKEVGVITFYAAQARELNQRLVNRAGAYRNLRLRVGTVDRFQGMERPVIIASLVRNNPNGAVGFARKPERVNVAFSRAQELLIIIGSRELFAEQARNGGADAAMPQNGAATIKAQHPGAQPALAQPATAIYSRVAQVVQQAGGLRRTADVPNDRR